MSNERTHHEVSDKVRSMGWHLSDEELLETLQENIRQGYIEEAGVGPDGEMRYRLTAAGMHRAQSILDEFGGIE